MSGGCRKNCRGRSVGRAPENDSPLDVAPKGTVAAVSGVHRQRVADHDKRAMRDLLCEFRERGIQVWENGLEVNGGVTPSIVHGD